MTAITTPLPAFLRPARPDDSEAIQAIYRHYVSNTFVSFEEDTPSVEEMKARMAKTKERGLPYLVAECNGDVLGYCYAGPFRPRSAYRYTIEDSIYVAPMVGRRGIGTMLLSGLVEECTALGFRQMIAFIGDSANQASIAVHRKQGFRQEGVLRGVGLKMGRWIDIVIMHRPLGNANEGLPGPDQPGLPPGS